MLTITLFNKLPFGKREPSLANLFSIAQYSNYLVVSLNSKPIGPVLYSDSISHKKTVTYVTKFSSAGTIMISGN